MPTDKMTGRERVTRAIEHTGPDRVPFKHSYLPAAVMNHPEFCELLRRFPSDFEGEMTPASAIAMPPEYRRGMTTDAWGCVWTVLQDGMLGQVTGHPLADLAALTHYRWPKAADACLDDAEQLAANRTDRYFLTNVGTVFERLIDLRGFEPLLCDIAEGNPAVPLMIDRVTEYNLGLIKRLGRLKPDGLFLSDDWGSQLSLMINPRKWRELFLPAYQRMFAAAKDVNCHVWFHTDGVTTDILSDLVAAGADVFWADLTINDRSKLRQLAGDVSFLALTDVQNILPHGTPQECRKHARELLDCFAMPEGGFIASSEIDPGQPIENVEAVFEEFHILR